MASYVKIAHTRHLSIEATPWARWLHHLSGYKESVLMSTFAKKTRQQADQARKKMKLASYAKDKSRRTRTLRHYDEVVAFQYDETDRVCKNVVYVHGCRLPLVVS